MIFLLFAILLSTSIFIIFRLFPKYNVDNFQAIIINYVVAVAFGLFISDIPSSFQELINKDWFYWSILVGFIFIIVFYLFALSSQKMGIAITAVSSKMSVVIPVLLGFVYFNEEASMKKIVGIALVLVAFFLLLQNKKGSKINYKYLFLPILIFLGNGLNDSLNKNVQFEFIQNDTREYFLYLTVLFAFALIFGLIITLFRPKKSRKKINKQTIIGGFILGIFNYVATLVFIRGLNEMNVSIFLPILNVSIVSLSAILGLIIFKEELKLKKIIGILIAILAILLISEFI
jgi:drug/metabolite transporter (DMT)-like permease